MGIYKESNGLKHAQKKGIETSYKGIDAIKGRDDIKLIFDATTAIAHLKNAPIMKQEGKIAIDLTPAAVGPFVVPVVNLAKHMDRDNINLVTCGGQATIPIVYAVSQVTKVDYAEIVATIASKSAGPGTRANIDEFTETTSKGIEKVGGAERAKSIIILNPAEPPLIMRDTIYIRVHTDDISKITESIEKMVKEVKEYVPGYRIKVPPFLNNDKLTVMIEVEGAGEYLPKYAGNLDIITSAAKATGERIALNLLK